MVPALLHGHSSALDFLRYISWKSLKHTYGDLGDGEVTCGRSEALLLSLPTRECGGSDGR